MSKERTRLSWRRTTLSATAVTLLLIRLAILQRHWAVAAIAALLWVALLAFIQRRIQVLDDPPRLRFRLLALTSLAGLSFAALGVVVVLL
jgi:hypothetical protein